MRLFPKLEVFVNLVNQFGFETACKNLGITQETGGRYLRKYREANRQQTTISVAPKILLLDIETSPLEAYIWQKEVWKAKVNEEKLISDWFIISYAAKWLNEEEIISGVLTPEEVIEENDRRIVGELWDLFNEAEIIIAHNGDEFDIPNIKSRFIVYNMMPPIPYKTIDTLKIARREFGFTYNSLNALANKLNLETKLEVNFKLWRESKRGNPDALKEMNEYNKVDVLVLESVYLALRPWSKNSPNMNLYNETEERQCPICGSTHITEEKGNYYTQVGKYTIYRCHSCGAVSRGRQTLVNKIIRKNIIVGA